MSAPKSLIAAVYLLAAAHAGALHGKDGARADDAAGNPFTVGERLVYTVQWDPPWYFFFLPRMHAGEAELWLAEETEHRGRKVLRISFNARSSGALINLTGMKIEDHFVFLSETGTLCALRASSVIREGRRKRRIDVEYMGESGSLHIRDLDESVTPPAVRKDTVKEGIPACVQDPFSALYFLRTLPLTAGYEHTSLLANDDLIKEVRSRVKKQDVVEAPAGRFTAWKIETIALMGGLFKEGGQFSMWLSADEKKIPVQFEIQVKLGRVFGRLKEVSHIRP